MSQGGARSGAAAGAAAGATATALARRVLGQRPPGGASRWERTNHRGATLTLLEGPAVALGAAAGILVTPGHSVGQRGAGALAVLGAGTFGAYDDLTGATGSKGLRGHLEALRRGELTSGIVKIAGIGATGVASAWLLAVDARAGAPRGGTGARELVDVLVGGAVVAASANLLNLFDLRPGRALKVGLLGVALLRTAGGTLAAGPLGAALAALSEDLGEAGMLGDTGANALGAGLGVALVVGLGPAGRLGALGVLTALTLASERISFTRVIEATPPLRWVDQLGRRPAAS